MTHLESNEAPCFEIVSYSYMGEPFDYSRMPYQVSYHLSFVSEAFGHSLHILSQLLNEIYKKSHIDSFFILNGDIRSSVSDLNRLFAIADRFKLIWFQPSLHYSSYITHPFTQQDLSVAFSERPFRLVRFCELMCFGLPAHIFFKIGSMPLMSISGWGIDKYILPYLFYVISRSSNPCACIVDNVSVVHADPPRSPFRRYNNGLTAAQEMSRIKTDIKTNLLLLNIYE